MEILPSYKKSFFASRERPDGLGLTIMKDRDTIHCDVRLDDRFNNEAGVVSSGILFGIMDVMMWCAVLMSTGKVCVTRRVSVDFAAPVESRNPYKATGRFIRTAGKDLFAAAYLKDVSGNTCASVDAVFRESNEVSLDQVMEHLDFSGISTEVKAFFQSLLSESRDHLKDTEQQTEYYPYGPL
jgi:acyl-coenzyme A thioesterase PaaI-like protein